STNWLIASSCPTILRRSSASNSMISELFIPGFKCVFFIVEVANINASRPANSPSFQLFTTGLSAKFHGSCATISETESDLPSIDRTASTSIQRIAAKVLAFHVSRDSCVCCVWLSPLRLSAYVCRTLEPQGAGIGLRDE